MDQLTIQGIKCRHKLSLSEIYKHLCLVGGGGGGRGLGSLSKVSAASASLSHGFPKISIWFGMVSRVWGPR